MWTTLQVGRSRRWRRRSCCACCVWAPLSVLAVLALVLAIVYRVNNREPVLSTPTHALPVPNAFDDFVHAGRAAMALKHKGPLYLTGTREENEAFANFRDCALEAGPVHDTVRAALAKDCRWPPSSGGARESDPTPGACLRATARILWAVAGYQERIGQPGAAADTLLDGMEMGVMASRGGGLMANMVGGACERICMQNFDRLVPRLTAAELRRCASRLDRIEAKRASYQDMVREQGSRVAADSLAFLHRLNQESPARRYHDIKALIQPWVFPIVNGAPNPDFTWPPKERAATRDELRQMAAFAFANKDRIVHEGVLYFDALAKEGAEPYAGPSRVVAPRNALANGYDEAYGHYRAKFVSNVAMVTLWRTELALRRYRLATGRFPATLADLVPAYLPAVPVDPCTGAQVAPVGYRLVDDGKAYLLYSVGPDMRDDGGLAGATPYADEPGDLVAGNLRGW